MYFVFGFVTHTLSTLCLGQVNVGGAPAKTAAERGILELDGEGMPLNVTISPGREGPWAYIYH